MLKIKETEYDVYFNEYDYETLDDSVILYLKNLDVIMSLNVTSTFIWQYLLASIESKENINDEMIAREMINKYGWENDLYETVLNDVVEILNLFIKQRLLLVC